MVNNKDKNDHKKVIAFLMLFGTLISLFIGIVIGIELYQIASIKLGFWEGKVEATHIVILFLRHQIQGSNRVRTTIEMGNTGQQNIFCNCTLYYRSALSEDLARYSFNATINAGETQIRAFTVTPIEVSQWTGTDISIFEY